MQLVQIRRVSDVRPQVGLATLSSLTLCVTHSCNISCSHCSVEAVGARAAPLASHDVIRAVAEKLIRAHAKERCGIVFFGGEPLLAPVAWYRETIRILRSAGVSLSLGVQTNGTILSRALIDLFLEEQVEVSVSLDGDPTLNDQVRERGRRVADNLVRMTDAGLAPKVVALIAPHTWQRVDSSMEYFQGLGLTQVRFNTCFNVGRNQEGANLAQAELAEAWMTIFRRMARDGGTGLRERNVADKVRLYAESAAASRSGCSDFYCHAGRSYLSIAPNGDLYPCSDITFTRPELRLGSVFDEPIMRDLEALRAFHHKGAWWDDCKTCSASSICELGCPAFTARGSANTHLECEATKRLHAFFVQHHDEVLALGSQLARGSA